MDPVLAVTYCMFFLGSVYAIIMLISPRTWARLPHWMGGPKRQIAEWADTTWGAFWVRISGVGFLIVVGWLFWQSPLLHR